MDYRIEMMQPEDWSRVAAIYQEGIETGLATFQGQVPSWEDWDRAHISSCRLVARKNDEVLGWAALSAVSSRSVYAGIGEVSVYVGAAYQKMGVGTALLNELIRQSENNGFWMLQGVITKENIASIELHKKCGFRLVGIRERIGRMPGGVWHDTALMERRSRTVGM
ncbi:MAG: GNAT family N-acetyltransferase [Bacillota bacterium]|nr:GNAT family N-acetyltransferase [Eubacteriales bacterium]MDI9492771.1 GNAT family N-acetyltransferase [Bacillota bacterium]NLV70809.1 N-acetyltransferase [Clostridiales bacterium]HRV33849.1 N-acetyltransferase family protein [Anaerovoracaceae bacterium]MDD3537573.1 GNAT family N-acetyltransferase [Eubacteriales bacterium]